MKKVFILFFLVFMFTQFYSKANQAHACDFCVLHQGITPLESLKNNLRIDARITKGDSIFVDGDKADNEFDLDATFLTYQLSGTYAFTDKFFATLILPVVDRDEDHLHEHDEFENENLTASGLGDLTLLGNYIFFSRGDTDNFTKTAVQFGIKAPTGATDKMIEDDRVESHLQPGSGSVDFLFGVNAVQSFERFSLFGSLLYKLNTEGDFNYQFGNTLNYDLVGRFRVLPAESIGPQQSFYISLGLNGEHIGDDEEDGMKVPDQGGDIIYLSPGIQFFPVQNILMEIVYQHPIYRDFNGEEHHPQVAADYRVIAGVQLFFDK